MAEQTVSELVPVVQTSPFLFKDHPIRTRFEGETLWFVAKDVCAALDIGWRGNTLANIAPEWQGMRNFRTPHPLPSGPPFSFPGLAPPSRVPGGRQAGRWKVCKKIEESG